MAARLSGIRDAEQDRLRQLLEAARLPVEPPEVGSKKLRQAMKLDKKVSAKALKFVLLSSLGNAFVTTDYSEPLLSEILRQADPKPLS